MGDVVRGHWGWTNNDQWIVSDCDAIQNIYLPHEWAATREEAAADALKAGVDINCGEFYPEHLPAALSQELISETDLDTALIRQYSSLIRLGYFDSPDDQPYRQLTFDDVDTPAAQQLAYRAAAEGIALLKNDGTLPIKIDSSVSVALLGDWANATEQMQGNYYGVAPYLHGPLYALNQTGATIHFAGTASPSWGNPTTNSFYHIYDSANASDIIVYLTGIDNDVESEGMDRLQIAYTGNQVDLITNLAKEFPDKPLILGVFGAGQIDSLPFKEDDGINSILWGGYPGQDGGSAFFDILTGKVSPAGRLPVTQYPADYIAQVPMTNMSLRPGENNPGRTYIWYNGTATYEFGYGLHYTNFSASISDLPSSSFAISDLVSGCANSSETVILATNLSFTDRCAFQTLSVDVTNTGNTTSDYSTLAFISGSYGPEPYPNKQLVAYQRLFNVSGGDTQTASLNLTLASLSRVDDSGSRVLYPGDYSVLIDTQPLAVVNFTLTGDSAVLDEFPAMPAQFPQNNTGDYYVGGYGSEEKQLGSI